MRQVMATRQTSSDVSFGELVGEELNSDNDFRREWLRLAPARQFAVMLIGYRSDHELSQRALAEKLGVSAATRRQDESGARTPTSPRSSPRSSGLERSSFSMLGPRSTKPSW